VNDQPPRAVHDECIAGLADLDGLDGRLQRHGSLLRDSHVKSPDDLLVFIENRLIGGNVPAIHHEGPPPIGFPLEDGLGDLAGGRQVGSHGPAPVGPQDIGRNPQEPVLLDALENGAGPPHHLLDLVHEGIVPGDLLPPDRPKRYPDAGDLFGNLIFRIKYHHPLWRDFDPLPIPVENSVGNPQIGGKLLLEELLLSPAHGKNVGDDVIEVRLVGLLQVLGEFLQRHHGRDPHGQEGEDNRKGDQLGADFPVFEGFHPLWLLNQYIKGGRKSQIL